MALKIMLSGQKFFAKEVYKAVTGMGHDVPCICTPIGDRYLLPYALHHNPGIKVIPGGQLSAETMPAEIDLGICAHSFDYVGRKTRYKTRLGWISYHPSLLPRHRGRSSIEWALRMGDIVTGGTVFWLNAGVDRGDIERQEWVWLDHNKTASEIWRGELLPMGVRLLSDAVRDISEGKVNRLKQPEAFSTFEPSLENIKDLYRPDLLMLNSAG